MKLTIIGLYPEQADKVREAIGNRAVLAFPERRSRTDMPLHQDAVIVASKWIKHHHYHAARSACDHVVVVNRGSVGRIVDAIENLLAKEKKNVI